MPWAYQSANPAGSPLHREWLLFKFTPRIKNAFRISLPLKPLWGKFEKRLIKWQDGYPMSPETTLDADGNAWVDYSVEGSGFSIWAAWLGGKWVPCLVQWSFRTPWGRVLKGYIGLKQDITLGDFMGWIEPSLSWNKEIAC